MVVYIPHPSLKGRIRLWDNLYFHHGQKFKEQTKSFKIHGSEKENLLLNVFGHPETTKVWHHQVHCDFKIESQIQAQTQIQVSDLELRFSKLLSDFMRSAQNSS